MVRIRAAEPKDRPLIEDMLAEAADWRAAVVTRPTATVMADPELGHYASDWPKPRDFGLVAEDDQGGSVGAAWWRFFTADHPGYGFVDAATPELAMGVLAGKRGLGVGSALLEALVQAARAERLPRLSLSVEPDNYAVRMYERAGFEKRAETGGSWTMVLDLSRR